MTEQKLHTVVLMGGWSHERDVSMRSGMSVYENIDSRKYQRRCLQILSTRQVKLLPEEIGPEDACWEASDPLPFLDAFKQLEEWHCHVAVLALHGEGGEDGVIQGFLETLGMPYTHSDVRGSAVAMDKEFSKYVYQARNIPTANFAVISRADDVLAAMDKVHLTFPIVAKPTILGSSYGVQLLYSLEELKKSLETLWKYDNRFILEEYIKGREFTCVVLDRGAGRELQPMPVTEIVPVNSAFFDYEAKYADQATKEITPAEISDELAGKIQAAALASHTALKCSSVTRTDVLVSKAGELYVLETNTIPGMTRESLLPKAAQAAGISFSELLDILIETAIQTRKK